MKERPDSRAYDERYSSLEQELGLGDWESPILVAAREASEKRQVWEAAARRARRHGFWRRLIYIAVATSAVATGVGLWLTWIR